MTGKPLRLLSVGKLKVPFWKDAAAHYSQRINRWRRLECVEVRDGDPALPQAQRNELEGRRLLEALGSKSIPLTALFPAGEQASSPLVLRDVYTAGTLEDAMEKAFGQ